SNQINPQAGLNGRLQLAMSTSFQLAGGSYPISGLPLLQKLFPRNTRVQLISNGLPLTAPGMWDFATVNAMLSQLHSRGDHSPELQIANAPAYMNDSNGHLMPGSYPDFAQMSADLVRYFNTGGFTAAGTQLLSPMPYPITWWGIFNEPNGSGLDAQA